MSNTLVRQAFEARLATWAASRGYPVDWENTGLFPPNTLYLRAFVLRAPTQSLTLDGNHRLYSGVFQVSIVSPVGAGAGSSDQIAQDLDDLFTPSAPIVVSGLKVYLTSPMSPATGIQEPDRWVVPVSAQFQAHTYFETYIPPPPFNGQVLVDPFGQLVVLGTSLLVSN